MRDVVMAICVQDEPKHARNLSNIEVAGDAASFRSVGKGAGSRLRVRCV